MGGEQTAQNVFLVLSYIFIVLMILVCVIAAGLVWRWLTGLPRRLGASGFAIIGLSAFLQLLRNLMVTFVLTDDVNYNGNLVNLLDLFTALIRLFGVVVVAAGLLSVARDLGAVLSGSKREPESASSGSTVAPQPYQTSATQYLGGPQQPAYGSTPPPPPAGTRYGSVPPPQHQPSAQQPAQGWGPRQ